MAIEPGTLAVDGIWGPASKAATAYFLGTPDSTSYWPTDASSLYQVFTKEVSCRLIQRWLNGKRLWMGNPPTRTAPVLSVDGFWGAQTYTGLAHAMLAVHQGSSMNLYVQPSGIIGGILGQVGGSILFWQAFLNNAIQNVKGRGPSLQSYNAGVRLLLNSSEFSTDAYLLSQL